MMTSSSSNNNSSSSFLLVILHHFRLCYNYFLSFIFGHRRRGHRNNFGEGGGGGISIVSLKNLFQRNLQQQLTFDNGTQIYIGDQIAEGGFSFVFEAFAVHNNNHGSAAATTGTTRESRTNKRRYALKRINCGDYELVQSCRHEAGIHRSLPSDHPNLLELLGLKFDSTADADGGGVGGASSSSRRREEYNVCYMLFPYLPYSLRGEITLRNILGVTNNQTNYGHQQHYNTNSNNNNTRRQPFKTHEVLHLFSGILDGLLAMHSANISHRDVKLENILLSPNSYGDHADRHHHHHHHHTHTHHHGSSGHKRRMKSRYTPILMDFGSAGPLLSQNLTSRQGILQIIELASIHTTLSYRPPELTEGCCNLRHGSEEEEKGEGCKLDYGKVDVWSLGCVLFGLLHGVSPFEMEFVRSGGNGGGDGQYGLVRVVDCTNLKILDEVPFPPWAGGGLGRHDGNNNSSNSSIGGEGGDGSNGKYPLSIYKFIRYMVQHDRLLRPNIQDVAKRFGELYYELLHEEWIPYSDKRGGGISRMGDVNDDNNEEREHDDFDSLIASRDFV
jgi:serine/threonine kinase 16